MRKTDYLKEAKKHLKLWLAAEAKIAQGQSYQIGTRSLTRADLNAVRSEIKFWRDEVRKAEAEAKGKGRGRIYAIIPRDL